MINMIYVDHGARSEIQDICISATRHLPIHRGFGRALRYCSLHGQFEGVRGSRDGHPGP